MHQGTKHKLYLFVSSSKLWFIFPRSIFPSFMCLPFLPESRRMNDPSTSPFPSVLSSFLPVRLRLWHVGYVSLCLRDENNFSPSLSFAGFDRCLLNRCGHVEAEYWCNSCNVLWLWGKPWHFDFSAQYISLDLPAALSTLDRREGRVILLLNGIDILWCWAVFSLLRRGRTMYVF